MSELREWTASEIEEYDDARLELSEDGKVSCTKLYIKSEADKVIAELKADYQEACDRLQTANLIKDEQLAETRHHKFKRCLNKAEWCEERCARYDLLQEHSGFSLRREIDFYFRWHCRWLELAEKFKEGDKCRG